MKLFKKHNYTRILVGSIQRTFGQKVDVAGLDVMNVERKMRHEELCKEESALKKALAWIQQERARNEGKIEKNLEKVAKKHGLQMDEKLR